eukprot:16445187-Heterocapsa_arctica.AAC.1
MGNRRRCGPSTGCRPRDPRGARGARDRRPSATLGSTTPTSTANTCPKATRLNLGTRRTPPECA